MKMRYYLFGGILCLSSISLVGGIEYPDTPVREVVHQYGPVELRDPFAWLEERNSENEAWFRKQDAFARDRLGAMPDRDVLFERIKEIDEAKSVQVSGFHRRNERYFHLKREVGEEVDSLYYRDGIDSISQRIVDPNILTKSDGVCSIQYYNPSFDGIKLLVGIAEGGNEIPNLYVVEVETGKVLEPAIPRVRWFPHWLPNNSGFYYTQMRPIDPNEERVDRYKRKPAKFHKLGTDAEYDPVIVSFDETPSLGISEVDTPLLFPIPGTNITRLRITHDVDRADSYFFARNVDPRHPNKIEWIQICSQEDRIESININNDMAYLLCSKDAPKKKIQKVDLRKFDRKNITEFLPESDRVLSSVRIFGGRMYVKGMSGGIDFIMTRDLEDPDDSFSSIELPFIGRVQMLSNDYTKSDLFLDLEGWTRESAYYRYDPLDGSIVLCNIRPLGPYDSPKDLVIERVMVKSHDGVHVPLTIVRDASVQLDGTNPTILYGYGAYGISLRPYFNPLLLPWYENGGVYAVANVRGGGEFGGVWHEGGHMETKRNSWLDLNACAEFLIDNNYAGKGTISAMGASMGGVLVGRAMTSQPDLYGAVISMVGCHNPVRIHRQANGPANFPEFGNPLDQEEFPYVLAMDSYFAVKDGVSYPPMLITAGWNDARVEPWEPGKFAARLQLANPDGGPYLLRVGFEAGHRDVARSDSWEAHADRYAFLFWALKGCADNRDR